MTRKVTSYRLPEMTLNQLKALTETTGSSDANVIAFAIDRMYQQEMKTMNSQTATLRFVAQSGHAWEEQYDSLNDANDAIPAVVKTHGDIEKVYLLDEDGDIDKTLWKFE